MIVGSLVLTRACTTRHPTAYPRPQTLLQLANTKEKKKGSRGVSEGLALEAMMLARSGRRNRGNGSITRLRRVGNTESE